MKLLAERGVPVDKPVGSDEKAEIVDSATVSGRFPTGISQTGQVRMGGLNGATPLFMGAQVRLPQGRALSYPADTPPPPHTERLA